MSSAENACAEPPAGGEAAVRFAGFSRFAAVYEEHSRPIYYLCLRMLGHPAQAEDAVHDVFLKAFRHLEEFKGRSQIRTWLYRIALNHCQNLLRSWHQRNVRPCSEDSIWETRPANEGDPIRNIELNELGTRIQQTLDTLPEEYRMILLLVADERMSYEAVAELIGQTADAVRGKLHRARRAFAAHFPSTA